MDTERLAEVLNAAGHATRLDALRLLSESEDGLPAGEIARRLGLLQNTLSSHLKKLAGAGLVEMRRSGTTITYCLDRAALAEVAKAISSL